MPLMLSYDPDNDGQAALEASSASRSNYAFKIEFGGIVGEPELFGQVVSPQVVLTELQSTQAPDQVRQWFAHRVAGGTFRSRLPQSRIVICLLS